MPVRGRESPSQRAFQPVFFASVLLVTEPRVSTLWWSNCSGGVYDFKKCNLVHRISEVGKQPHKRLQEVDCVF